MSDEKFPSKWESVAGLSRLRVPGGWLVEWGANDSAPHWFPDPAGAWVVDPEPVEPPAVEPAKAVPDVMPTAAEAWAQKCSVLGAHVLHTSSVGRDGCGWFGGESWISERVPMTVNARGWVILWPARATAGRGDGVPLTDAAGWRVPDGSPLRAEAERVVAVASAVYGEIKAAAEADRVRREQEHAAACRHVIAAAESVLREVDHG